MNEHAKKVKVGNSQNHANTGMKKENVNRKPVCIVLIQEKAERWKQRFDPKATKCHELVKRGILTDDLGDPSVVRSTAVRAVMNQRVIRPEPVARRLLCNSSDTEKVSKVLTKKQPMYMMTI